MILFSIFVHNPHPTTNLPAVIKEKFDHNIISNSVFGHVFSLLNHG